MKAFEYQWSVISSDLCKVVGEQMGLWVMMLISLTMGLILVGIEKLIRRQLWFVLGLLLLGMNDVERLHAADHAYVAPAGTTDISGGNYNTNANNSPAISVSGAGVVVTGSALTGTSSGQSSDALRVSNGAQVILDDSNLSTSGTFSSGVNSSGTGTKVTLNRVTISTAAYQAHAVKASSGAMVMLNGGTFSTNALINSAYALYATGTGTVISGSGVTIRNVGTAADVEQGATLNLIDSDITITGTFSAYGVYASNQSQTNLTRVNITTLGDYGDALYTTNNAQVTVNGGTYSTQGRNADGVLALTSTVSLSHLVINTTGIWSNGINANRDSSVQLNDVAVSTQAANAYGIWGVGNTLMGTDVRVSTAGDSTHGICIQSGTATFDGLTIHTSGSNAYGLYTERNMTVDRLNISTSGATGVGVAVFGAATVSLDSGTIQTAGKNGYGLYASVGSLINASDLAVHTSGSSASGVYANGGSVTLQGGAYSTSGVDAYGLRALKGVIHGNGVTVDSAQSSAVMMTDASTVTMIDSQVGGKDAAYVIAKGSSAPGVNTVMVNGGVVSAAAGNAFQVNSGSASITVADAVVSGSNILAISGSDDVRFTAQHSLLTGALSGNDYSGASTVLLGGQWTITGNSLVNQIDNTALVYQNRGAYKTVTVTGNYSGNSDLAMNADIAAGTGDQLVVNGTASGRKILLTLNGANPSGAEEPLLMVHTAVTEGSFYGSADKGMYRYGIVSGSAYGKEANDWYLGNEGEIPVPPDPANDSGDTGNLPVVVPPDQSGQPNQPVPPSATASTILGMVAAQSLQWFTQLDTLNKRMGELRLEMDNGKVAGDVWLRSYGAEMNVGSAATGRAFDSQLYGFDVGVDKAWQIDANNTLVFGLFGGYGVADQDFNINGSQGESDSIYGGLYGTWLHRDGWYADLVAKVQHFDNSFDVWDDSYNHSTGGYEDWGAGVSLEFGRQIKFKDGWFIEPQAQVNYVHLFNNGFNTQGANAFAVDNRDADIWQFRGGMAFGRSIRLNQQAAVLQPYVKVSGVEEISSGDQVSADGATWRPNMDGLSVEFNAGVAWQIDESNQLHVEYQAALGDKYDQPWGINAGFRHKF